MNKSLLFVAAVLGILIIDAALIFYIYIRHTLAFGPLPSYNTTIISGRPDGATCLNLNKEGTPDIAIELIDLGNDVVYLAGGSNPITEAQWEQTSVRFPHRKNSKRYLLFDDSCLYRSPDKPADCQGEECFTFVELFDHSWFVLNALSGQGCYPDDSGCSGDEVQPGYVSITTIDKCQEITFSGPTILELVDDRGNRYVMHATDDGQPDVAGVPLPEGWHLSEVEISEPLLLQPRGEGHCYYNIIRDAQLQSYHQYLFVDERYPPSE